LCAGIDPSPGLLARWDLDDDASGAYAMGARCIESFAPWCSASSSVAFFERFGSAGLATLEALLRDARAAGLITIGDAKRGDIASTNEAYAQAWLFDGPLGVDAMTVSPLPRLRRRWRPTSRRRPPTVAASSWWCAAAIRRVARSRRRCSRAQKAALGNAVSIEAGLLGDIERQPADSVGAVIGHLGATRTDCAVAVAGVPRPGVGAQGATVRDLASLFWHIPIDIDARQTCLARCSAAGPDPRSLSVAAEHAREEVSAGFCPPA